MFDFQIILNDIFNIPQMVDTYNFLIPYVGVGGGIEAREHVELINLLKYTITFLGGFGIIFGIGLALTAKKFSVVIDPRVEKVKEVLANAHCGACGYAGCEQYAEAVVRNPDVPPNLCIPGGSRTSEAIALITNKKAVAIEPAFARIMCQGGSSKSVKKFIYEGVQDCRAVLLAGGGDKACKYGCLGYGTCSHICPFGAISMTKDHLPYIDLTKCTGCRKCETVCPTKVIEVLPAAKQVLVLCHSKDKGAVTKNNCKVGCIGCGICVKVCPFDATLIENNLSRINLDKCRVCGICAKKCPTGAINDFIPKRPKAFIKDNCIGCEICSIICPVNAPSGEAKQIHRIDQSKCTGCGICTFMCPVHAIDGTFNANTVIAEAERKREKAA